MTDRPIIFSGPMVRALIEGRKTQTRRLLRVQPPNRPDWKVADQDEDGVMWMSHDGTYCACRLPYAPRDRLWVREAHALVPATAYRASEGVQQAIDPNDFDRACIYREGFDRSTGGIRWRSPIHMPRWASRLTLTVTDVRVQRLQDITLADARAEGVWFPELFSFLRLWNSLHGPDAWEANPWVCALSFTVEQRNIDA